MIPPLQKQTRRRIKGLKENSRIQKENVFSPNPDLNPSVVVHGEESGFQDEINTGLDALGAGLVMRASFLVAQEKSPANNLSSA